MATSDRGTLRISRLIQAAPPAIYRALLDPGALVTWRPPAGMKARFDQFEPRPGGRFRMALEYLDADHAVPGKTSEHVDVVHGRFSELVANERVVEEIEFESDDPAFAGVMTLTTTLTPAEGGTLVTIVCENAPSGIRPSDHETGMRSSLQNLAAFVE